MPRGGTISTSVTKLPSAIKAPMSERAASGAGGVSVLSAGAAPEAWTRAWASRARIADRMARMWLGVVPQQPPTICAPAAMALRAKLAMYSGEHR